LLTICVNSVVGPVYLLLQSLSRGTTDSDYATEVMTASFIRRHTVISCSANVTALVSDESSFRHCMSSSWLYRRHSLQL